MPTAKLPARPSLESLRKQARRLTRDVIRGEADAIKRVHAQLPHAKLPLSHRDTQLVLAREYGFTGWKALVKEVEQRLGRGLEWAASEGRRIIHDNDVEGLRRLLAEYPSLVSWTTDETPGGLLGIATGSFGDSGDPYRERHFTRKACAELLLDAGAIVTPSVCDGLIRSRARGLIDLFHRRGLIPQSLKFLAALGELDGVGARLDANADDQRTVNEAFLYAGHLGHAPTASLLLDRSIALDAELGRRIDAGPGRSAFVQSFIDSHSAVEDPDSLRLWEAFVKQRVLRAIDDGDLSLFVNLLRSEAWLLSNASVKFQIALIERTSATLNDRALFLRALLDLNPAVLRTAGSTHGSRAFIHAFTYAQAHLLPSLMRVWPLPDDLPHAAGSGDLARVKHWFDVAGRPALGNLAQHFPANDDWIRGNLQWGKPDEQQVLDTALAFAVMNSHFEIAAFLLDRGADINTNWSSHEPASILHELVWHRNYEAMQFLIDRGIDMTTEDYRWHATAVGWAAVAAKDEKMAQWLRDAQQRQEQRNTRDTPARQGPE